MDESKLAAGRVITGYSKPYVALYTNNGGTVTYSEGRRLARGVNVEIELTTDEENIFYADNVAAETAPGVFSGGTLTMTVDGLLHSAQQMIKGLPEAKPLDGETGVNVYSYGEASTPPYVGVGFIVRYMSNGITMYEPVMLTKLRFNQNGTSAATQEESIEWQTEELTAAIMRDDTAEKNWKKIATEQATEEDAEKIVRLLLNIQEADA